MGTGDRFLLFVAAILLVILAFGVILMAFNLGPVINLGTQLARDFIYGHWEAALVGVAILIVGLRLVYISLLGRKSEGALVARSELGDVSITIPAVENMVQRTAMQVEGIREVRPSVVTRPEGVAVKIKAWLQKDVNVPELAAEVQEVIKSYLKEVAGLAVTSIGIEVQAEGSEPTFKARPGR